MPDAQARRSLKAFTLPCLVIVLPALLLIALTVWPQLDIAASAVFFEPGHSFPLSTHPLFIALHNIGVYSGWVMTVLFCVLGIVSFVRKKPTLRLDSKAWFFLLLTLLIGPGLLANVVFKDHWGRARPYKVTLFEGTANFTPVFVRSHECDHNCSFVAGDPSFGFFMPTFAYVVPRRSGRGGSTSRWAFWGGMSCGILLGIDRLTMGAHFLSDILAAAFLVLGISAILHTMFYGRQTTRRFWREWLYFNEIRAD